MYNSICAMNIKVISYNATSCYFFLTDRTYSFTLVDDKTGKNIPYTNRTTEFYRLWVVARSLLLYMVLSHCNAVVRVIWVVARVLLWLLFTGPSQSSPPLYNTLTWAISRNQNIIETWSSAWAGKQPPRTP